MWVFDRPRTVPKCCGEYLHIHCVECGGIFDGDGDYVDFEDKRNGTGLCRRCYFNIGTLVQDWLINFECEVRAEKERDVLQELNLTHEGRRSISLGVRARIYRRDAYRCLICHATEGLTIDHIVPVNAGGSSAYDNLQTLCKSCNSIKGTKWGDYRRLVP